MYLKERSLLLPHTNIIQVHMNREHRFVAGNLPSVGLFGFRQLDDMLGLLPAEIKCDAASAAPIFEEQNNYVFETGREMISLELHAYAEGAQRFLRSRKSPLYDEAGFIKAVECSCHELQHKDLNLFLAQLLRIDHYITNDHGTYHTRANYTCQQVPHLSPRESECLFFLVRGFTAKEISHRLGIATPTVNSYIENLKSKLNCNSRSQMIERAAELNLLPVIPTSLLKHQSLSLIVNK